MTETCRFERTDFIFFKYIRLSFCINYFKTFNLRVATGENFVFAILPTIFFKQHSRLISTRKLTERLMFENMVVNKEMPMATLNSCYTFLFSYLLHAEYWSHEKKSRSVFGISQTVKFKNNL